MNTENDNNKEINNEANGATGETSPVTSNLTPISNDTSRPADPFATVGPPPHGPKKRSRWHWLWIAAAGLLVVMFLVNLSIEFFWRSGPIEASHVDTNRFEVSEINRLTTDLSVVRTQVRTHNGNEIIVRFDAPNRGRYMRPRWNLNDDGTLHIYSERYTWRSVRIMSLPLNLGGVLNIYLPSNMAQPLDFFSLRTSTGRIELNANLNIANTVTAQTSTGRIEANGFSADRVEIRATTGRVEVSNITAETIDIITSTGRIEARHLTAVNSLRISATTGRVEAANITTETVNVSTSTGRISLDFVEAARLDASATTGRIEMRRSNIAGDAALNTSTGRVDISGGSIGGWLTARTSTGRIELSGVDVDMNRATLSTNTGRIRTNR